MGFTIDDVLETLKIVKECKDSELHIDTGDLKLSLFKGEVSDSSRSLTGFSGNTCQSPQPTTETQPVVTLEKEPAAAKPVEEPKPEVVSDAVIEEGLVPIKANVTSVFYRRPSPEEPPFVEVGDKVEEDTVVCLLEVMKCFRQVTAEIRGTVEKVCVNNSELVQAGAVMFLVRPE